MELFLVELGICCGVDGDVPRVDPEDFGAEGFVIWMVGYGDADDVLFGEGGEEVGDKEGGCAGTGAENSAGPGGVPALGVGDVIQVFGVFAGFFTESGEGGHGAASAEAWHAFFFGAAALEEPGGAVIFDELVEPGVVYAALHSHAFQDAGDPLEFFLRRDVLEVFGAEHSAVVDEAVDGGVNDG